MSDMTFADRIEALAAKAIKIDTGINGKNGPIASYTVWKELRNEDGYYEGDGGWEVLCYHRNNSEMSFSRTGDVAIFDSVVEAVTAAERVVKQEEAVEQRRKT